MKKTFSINVLKIGAIFVFITLASLIYINIKINPSTKDFKDNFFINSIIFDLFLLVILLYNSPVLILCKPNEKKLLLFYYYKIVIIKEVLKNDIFLKTENTGTKKETEYLFIKNKSFEISFLWDSEKLKEMVSYYSENCIE